MVLSFRLMPSKAGQFVALLADFGFNAEWPKDELVVKCAATLSNLVVIGEGQGGSKTETKDGLLSCDSVKFPFNWLSSPRGNENTN